MKREHLNNLKIFVVVFAVLGLVYLGVSLLLNSGKKSAAPVRRSAPRRQIPARTAQSFSGQVDTALPAAPATATAAAAAEPVKRPLPGFNFAGSRRLPAALQRLQRQASSVIVVDLNSRQVLWHKNPKKAVAVASLTKMMTAVMIMEAINSRRDLDFLTQVTIDRSATEVERSCVLGAKAGEVYSLEELMAAMIINSHNDAAAQLAAVVGGSVENFVAQMNLRAAEMGLEVAGFNSPNGLPQGKHRVNSYSCAYDIVRICEYAMNFPELMTLCVARRRQLHTGRTVFSHNHLLTGRRGRPVAGLIGFKTGFTNSAGSCLAFGVTRNGRTILGCVTGFKGAANRDNFCRGVIEWAFKQPISQRNSD